MADIPVKTEALPVKMELDGDEEGGLLGVPLAADDDLYEDAGDLEFFDPMNPALASMYLVRVPPYVWEAWDKLDDDEEIQIATLRKWSEKGEKTGEVRHRMRMLLRSDLQHHQGLPKEYDLELPMVEAQGVQNTLVKNTFLFNEQDLPGFTAKNKLRAEAAKAGIPARLLRQKEQQQQKTAEGKGGAASGNGSGNGGGGGNNWRHGKRPVRQEYFRRAIPKKTTICGRVRHELNCAPVKNPESDFILGERARVAMKPKAQVKFGDVRQNNNYRLLGTGGVASQVLATEFIKTGAAPKSKKAETTKTARMPENDLLDLIFECFTRFRFWSMRALRASIPQPEVYLRQTLEKVADLHRSGRFANNWELKPENRKDDTATAEIKAEEYVAEKADSDSDGDEDVALEDVPVA